MGTNYYLKSKPCESCGHSNNEKHIGKSSCGWQFHFRGYRDEPLISFNDWLAQMKDPNKIIVDEYGKTISIDEFISKVESKKCEINSWNVNNNLSFNEKERTYLKNRSYLPIGDINNHSWKDNDGHPFTDMEFS